MKPYLWMTDFTPQEEWIEGKGLFLWLAFFFSEVGAGLYIVSLFVGFRGGALTGWICCAILGGGLHMAYLGKPMRFWRSILRPKSSELSRGIILMGLFLIIGALQIGVSMNFFSGFPGGGNSLFFKIVLSILAFFVITHGFTTLGFIRAVPFWNSAIMPVLSLASGLWLGSQIAIGLALGADQIQIPVILEPVARWFIFSYVLLTLFHFWTAWQGSLGSRKSIQLLIKGDLAPLFYLGVVLVALICLIITIYFCVKPVDTAFSLMWIRIFCAVIGDVAFRYCIFKAARYVPLINSNIITGIRFT